MIRKIEEICDTYEESKERDVFKFNTCCVEEKVFIIFLGQFA